MWRCIALAVRSNPFSCRIDTDILAVKVSLGDGWSPSAALAGVVGVR